MLFLICYQYLVLFHEIKYYKITGTKLDEIIDNSKWTDVSCLLGDCGSLLRSARNDTTLFSNSGITQ